MILIQISMKMRKRARSLGYTVDDLGSILVRDREGNFSLRLRVQTGCGSHPVSSPMSNRISYPRYKAAGAWSWPPTSSQCRG